MPSTGCIAGRRCGEKGASSATNTNIGVMVEIKKIGLKSVEALVVVGP
jgi:hypothetical protein